MLVACFWFAFEPFNEKYTPELDCTIGSSEDNYHPSFVAGMFLPNSNSKYKEWK